MDYVKKECFKCSAANTSLAPNSQEQHHGNVKI